MDSTYDFIKWSLNNFWRFVGVLMLLGMILNSIVKLIVGLVHGWPTKDEDDG